MWGDSAYSGQREVLQRYAPNAKNFIQTKAYRHRPLSEEDRARNRTKSKVRAKVDHAFLVIKRIFGWAQVRYRRLAKNTHWLQISCGLANLYVSRRSLLAGVSRRGVRTKFRVARQRATPEDDAPGPATYQQRICIDPFRTRDLRVNVNKSDLP